MKYKEIKINNLIVSDKYTIYDYKENEKEIHLYVKSKNKLEKCSNCNEECCIHSTYNRIIQDTPIHNKTTWLHVKAYEYECSNSKCEITTFNENLEFAKKHQVMTDSLIQLILCISIFLSNSSASLILSFIGVKVSADTIKNMYDRIKIIDNPDVEEIGIDDVATRKGMKYATAIYDLKDHHMIALLEGRDANSIKDWLKEHQKIKIVARDRASAYATAISEILPNCMQVADRFHLFENIIEYLKDIFYNEMPDKIFIQNDKILDESPKKIAKLKCITSEEILKAWNYDNNQPINELGNPIHYDDKKHDLECAQYIRQTENRLKKYTSIKNLRDEYQISQNIKMLSEKYNFSQASIKKYIAMTDEEVELIKERKNYKSRKTKIDNYKNIIYKMLKDNRNLYDIMNYIIYKGYDNDIRDLEAYIYLIAKNNFPNLNAKAYYPQCIVEFVYSDDLMVITRKDLLKNLLTVNFELKNENINKYMEIIEEKYPIVKEIKDIFQEYHSIIMGNDENKIEEFVSKYENSKISSLCNGLKKDIAAVKNAISSTINSGFVEGNNNKFKLIKRIVYGKMKLVNLFRKCYLAFLVTINDFSIYDLI